MDLTPLLAQPHLTVVTRHADDELTRIQDVIEHKVLVEGRGDLEAVLGQLLAGTTMTSKPKTLDLVGHSAPGSSLLKLGDWVIDASRVAVTAFFRELNDNNVLPRLGIYAVRLLGCHTAETPQGRSTICALSNILGVEVFGTRHLIYSAHYDARGFRDDCNHALVCSSDLRHDIELAIEPATGIPYPRIFDIDALPASPLVTTDPAWPRRVAGSAAAKDILRLIRRSHGAQMPGLLAAPSCEIALPSVKPDWYHVAQVLLDGEFVRVYPDGDRCPGVVFPVDDPQALRSLVAALPTVTPPVALIR
ncbi:MAG: hypothetical protein WKG01_02355 [Kofleriaceae bacterium]